MLNMSSAMSNTGAQKGQLLADIATFTYNPLRDPTVVQSLQDSTLLYILAVISFIFVGGSYVIFSKFKTARPLLGMDTGGGYTLSKWLTHLLSLIAIPPVLPIIMLSTLVFNYIICNMVMTGILPSILLTPDNTTLYVAMSFIYLLLAIAFVWRALIIGLSVACCLIIFLMVIMPITRDIGITLVYYFIFMVFMQPVILLITSIGVGIIKYIVPYDHTGQMFGYMVLGLLLFVVAFVFIIGPVITRMIFRKAVNKFRLVI